MKTISFANVNLKSGYLFDKQELNRKITIDAVYDRFFETGRIGAFDFSFDKEKDDKSLAPHFYWDSDVAKWIEGASYIIKKHNAPKLEQKIELLVSKIKKHQGKDGYFNIYFTVVEPTERFTKRDWHELYCAGHLIESAIAYAEATEKREFLNCMERYVDYIYKVFVEDKSASFCTPGHEEIELALIRLYRFTGNKKHLDLAKYFLNTRGTVVEDDRPEYNQSHKPIREQTEAVGHSVRAVYLYTAMAMLALETGDKELFSACQKLWQDIVERKMYVTGGIGSTCIGESFTVPYDLSNDQAYTETCASIGLIYFSNQMLSLENNAKYADVIERALYNGVLSGLSLDGQSFFYENPLEINLFDKFESKIGKRRFPITQRVQCFNCSCCPPNLNRLLASIGDYVYGIEDDTLFINQYFSSTLSYNGVECQIQTEYPNQNQIIVKAHGVKKVAVRIPEWCDKFKIDKKYELKNGYAYVDNDGSQITLELDLSPRIVYGHSRIKDDANKVCVMRGPVVYCAEAVDNEEYLHGHVLSSADKITEKFDEQFGLNTLEIECEKRIGYEGKLYSNTPPKTVYTKLKLIPYNCFANRGESNMLVWFCAKF